MEKSWHNLFARVFAFDIFDSIVFALRKTKIVAPDESTPKFQTVTVQLFIDALPTLSFSHFMEPLPQLLPFTSLPVY